MYIDTYKKLFVWQKSIELVKEIYKVTEHFPKSELYGLTSQIRRASVSIPSNIVEGYKRQGLGEYIQFLSIADASAAELETQIIIANELYDNVSLTASEHLLLEIQKMLAVMLKKLKAKNNILSPKRYTLYAKRSL